MNILVLPDLLLRYWIDAPWYIALAMAVVTNITVYTVTAYCLDFVIKKLVRDNGPGKYIDDRPLKPRQILTEYKNGVNACIVFAIASLLTRELYHQVWPATVWELCTQFIVFTVFYETYSYFVHRLLHTRWFLKIHGVHHWSVRVTPWSAYSVHVIEALFIGLSAPLYMLVFSLDLSVALGFHIIGMIFTILLHSNFTFTVENPLLRIVGNFSGYHRSHHLAGIVNFGFINSFWDKCFRTREKEMIRQSEQ